MFPVLSTSPFFTRTIWYVCAVISMSHFQGGSLEYGYDSAPQGNMVMYLRDLCMEKKDL